MTTARIDLTELLSERTLSHPTRITRGVLEGRDFHLTVFGYPWWRPNAGTGSEGAIELFFKNISEGLLDLPLIQDLDGDEDLEPFAVTSLVDIPWAQPSSQSIYASGPMSDPMRLYALLDAHLASVDAFTRPSHYLNAGDRPHRFVEFATSSSSLLATAPPSITRVICNELDAQGTPYTVHRGTDRVEGRLWVKLGDANFFCERAFAEFEN